MTIKWEKPERGVFIATVRDRAGDRYHLRVEKLPCRGWDWLIWRVGGMGTILSYGCALSAKVGMRIAERVFSEMLGGTRAVSHAGPGIVRDWLVHGEEDAGNPSTSVPIGNSEVTTP